ncbi:MAG: ABC transporter ATP-binding protein [Bacilli bacterium]|nr:ABC transporter ATP-binding protein [Bacilli bacterium]
MIEIRDLGKDFDTVHAVSHLNLTIEPGIAALVGENGAGKSTLLRLLSGILTPSYGGAYIDGNPVESKEAKEKVFFLSDSPSIPTNAFAKDIVELYSCFYDIDVNRFYGLMKKFNLPTDRRLSTFSKGMKRQLFIFLSISIHVPYLLMDEAFDGLDPVVLDIIKGELLEEREKGKTLILSSHNMSTLERLADRFIVLFKGQLGQSKEVEHLGETLMKFQAIFPTEVKQEDLESAGLTVISFRKVGSILNFVISGSEKEAELIKERFNPTLLENVPLDEDETMRMEMLLTRKRMEDHE